MIGFIIGRVVGGTVSAGESAVTYDGSVGRQIIGKIRRLKICEFKHSGFVCLVDI